MKEKEILSKGITSPNRQEFERQNQGIGLVIFNENDEILLGRQNHAEPLYGRNEGDWNIITETLEDGELIKGTVFRAIDEEMSVEPEEFYDLFEIIPGTYRETNGIYDSRIPYTFKLRCIALRYKSDSNREFYSRDGEIEEFRWVPLEKLDRYKIEEGARWVIDYYQRLLFSEKITK